MRHRSIWVAFSVVVCTAAWMACVGEDAPTGPGGVDGGPAETGVPDGANSDAGTDSNVLPDAPSDAGLDAADAADGRDGACDVPTAGPTFSCAATPCTASPNRFCCTSNANAVRECATSLTSCNLSVAATATAWGCSARAHCQASDVCCLPTKLNAGPIGTCPAQVNGDVSHCEGPIDGGGCSNSFLRLCDSAETCPTGMKCEQIRVNLLDTGGSMLTGVCQ